ncbi:MAG: methyltransferase family protein [Planctomycetaceae bacterium]
MKLTEAPAAGPAAATGLGRSLYALVAYFGLMSISGALLFGFRFEPGAPASNIWFNVAIYAAFMAPHLLMTRSFWKRMVTGNPAGSPRERQFYILLTLACWFAVIVLHRPVSGPALEVPSVVRFCGIVVFLMAFFLFFHGITMPMIDGLLGVPGSVQGYSHGADTPLFTEGAYAQVRHPMYRAAVLAGLASLFIHPNAGQLLWVGLTGGTFIGFIPVEERQMIAARGDAYLSYRAKTRWRLFRGIW